MANRNGKTFLRVEMTEKELQTLCDIVELVLERDDNFGGSMLIGYGESDDDSNVMRILTTCGGDVEDVEETEETLELVYESLQKGFKSDED